LVVDDSALVRKRLVEMLRDSRMLDVEEASSTDEAERVLSQRRIDVLVLDMHIGPNSGLEFLAIAKRLLPHVAILVLTNDAGDAHRRECMLRGADHFFDKSRDFAQAVEVIVAHAAARPSDRAALALRKSLREVS
jgi:two-component system chemotaxis response regulator CheY